MPAAVSNKELMRILIRKMGSEPLSEFNWNDLIISSVCLDDGTVILSGVVLCRKLVSQQVFNRQPRVMKFHYLGQGGERTIEGDQSQSVVTSQSRCYRAAKAFSKHHYLR